MSLLKKPVRKIDLIQVDEKIFDRRFVGCVILTHDNKILLQQRDSDWKLYPNFLAEFGGHIEEGESPEQALIRELQEELGAEVNFSNVISFGAITEKSSDHSELVHVFFWHDKTGTIKNCAEGRPCYFDNISQVLTHPKITDGLRWLLQECEKHHLLCR